MTEPAQALPLCPARLRDGSMRLPPLVSAHRAGLAPDRPGQDPRTALQPVLDAGCDLVEFDVRRTRDGVPVVEHEDNVAGGGRPVPVGALTAAELARTAAGCLRLEDALRMLAGRAGAHLDLKDVGTTNDLAALVTSAVGRLGVENVVVTGLGDEEVAAVRAWSRDRYPELLVGLALGRELRGLPPLRLVRTALEELFPGGRLRRTHATLIVCQKDLARAWIARWARRRRLPLLIWTVDKPTELRRWLAAPPHLGGHDGPPTSRPCAATGLHGPQRKMTGMSVPRSCRHSLAVSGRSTSPAGVQAAVARTGCGRESAGCPPGGRARRRSCSSATPDASADDGLVEQGPGTCRRGPRPAHPRTDPPAAGSGRTPPGLNALTARERTCSNQASPGRADVVGTPRTGGRWTAGWPANSAGLLGRADASAPRAARL